jgi:hypothetical protein
VRVRGVGVRQLWDHGHRLVVSDLVESDYLKQEVADYESVGSVWLYVI